jgi:uridine phosphorylase
MHSISVKKNLMQRQVHLSARDLLNQMQFKSGDFADIALVSGQGHRVDRCLEHLVNPVKNFSAMGYTFWTGTYNGVKITVGNAGLYAPDTALVTELLCEGGIQCLIRIGSCGALTSDIRIGDIVIADSALRGDGVTGYYVDKDFVPQATQSVTDTLFRIFSQDTTAHRGIVWTTDALLRETPAVVNPAIKKGAIAVDMVTSPFFTVASVYTRKSASILAVSDNLITGEIGFGSPQFVDAENKMVAKTLEAAKELRTR